MNSIINGLCNLNNSNRVDKQLLYHNLSIMIKHSTTIYIEKNIERWDKVGDSISHKIYLYIWQAKKNKIFKDKKKILVSIKDEELLSYCPDFIYI